MPFVPAVNTVRVAIEYISMTGEQAVNVQHFQNITEAPNDTNVAELLTIIKGWMTDHWSPEASGDWQTDLFSVRDMTVQDGQVWVDIETISGSRASAGLPAAVTLAMSTRTGFAGRSRRGRMFHVGLSENQVIGSRVELTAASVLPIQYQELVTDLSASDWRWVVASFVTGGAPRATALLTPITDVILTDTVVDSMDTRKPRAV